MKIGIVGAGQLGRMLAVAGYPLALQFQFLDASGDTPGGRIAPIVTGAFDDLHSLRRLANGVDPADVRVRERTGRDAEGRRRRKTCLPPIEALRVSQDRLYEKELFRTLGTDAAVPRGRHARRPAASGKRFRFCQPCSRRGGSASRRPRPAVPAPALRCRRRLERVARRAADPRGLRRLRQRGLDHRRSTRGETRVYPLTLNTHRDGILRVSVARIAARSCSAPPSVSAQAVRPLRIRRRADDRVLRASRPARCERWLRAYTTPDTGRSKAQ